VSFGEPVAEQEMQQLSNSFVGRHDGRSRQPEHKNLTANGGFGGAVSTSVTFDGGPHLDSTPEVLKALKPANVRATLFVVAELSDQHCEIVLDALPLRPLGQPDLKGSSERTDEPS
jgi:peptidoglycan/xylan/chitin deacetylase (PgdA/CDA1 family)